MSMQLFGWMRCAFVVVAVVAFRSEPSQAAGASDWRGDESGRVRLIAGARAPDGKALAGLQFDLGEGWKTYWRAPGDSGVPPVFDWKGSKNVRSIEVLWPAPSRFRDDFGWNNGYETDTVFPVEIVPERPTDPVDLELSLRYGVCRELCVPGKADLSLTLPSEGFSGHQALINRFLLKVPRAVDEDSAIRVVSVSTRELGGSVNLEVSLDHRSPEPVTLFVEGAGNLHFAAPRRRADGTTGNSRFRVPVDGAESPDDLKGAELRFTAVQGDLRLEQTWRMD